jgi:L-lysine exporter family protein LysE/ArgO
MPVSPVLAAGLSGFFFGASLIVAIGAQNAFVLRQGLLREHVFVLCLICALSDALLIAVGVGGFGTLVAQSDTAIRVVTWAGAVFLTVYGLIALRRAWKPGAMTARKDGGTSLSKAVATCLSFTFLNPHVYLDTVVALGAISGRYEGTGASRLRGRRGDRLVRLVLRARLRRALPAAGSLPGRRRGASSTSPSPRSCSCWPSIWSGPDRLRARPPDPLVRGHLEGRARRRLEASATFSRSRALVGKIL